MTEAAPSGEVINFITNISNLNYYYKLLNIEKIDDIESDGYIIKSENTTILDVSKEEIYVKSICPEFVKFFASINSKNENEYDREDLYLNRMEKIKTYKRNFLKNIMNIKRSKGTLEYIHFILDFYIGMRYYEQLTENVITGGDLFRTDVRYKLLVQGNLSKDISQVGDIFKLEIDTVVPAGTVASTQFTLSVELIDSSSYFVRSIVSYEEWDLLIKPIVHPVGFNDQYLNVNDSITDANMYDESRNLNRIDISLDNMNLFAGYENLSFVEQADIFDNFNAYCVRDLYKSGGRLSSSTFHIESSTFLPS